MEEWATWQERGIQRVSKLGKKAAG